MSETIDISTTPEVLHTGIAFGEGPRYRNNALYFSDMHAHQVLKFEPDQGSVSVVVELDEEPSGLGWLPNGDMVIVGMASRSLLRVVEQDANQPPLLKTWELRLRHARGREISPDPTDLCLARRHCQPLRQ